MALGVNTNVASLNAQRNLTRSQDTLNTALQRLSTGLRINSAKDDAAGLAIATRFTTQINGLNQAVRNANDGISLAQTGEAALSEITNNLQRIRELAVQSANSTNSTSDRAAIDLEVQQRLDEITRIGAQTTFNGQRILDGTFGTADFQVGANVGDQVSISLASGVKSNQIGQIASETGSVNVTGRNVLQALTADTTTISIGGGAAITIGASVAGTDDPVSQAATSAYAKAEAINGAGISGLTVTASTSVDLAISATVSSGSAYELSVNGTQIYNGTALTADLTKAEIVTAINAESATTGVTASETGGELTLSAADGRNITVVQTTEDIAEGITDDDGFDGAGNATDFSSLTADVTAVFSGALSFSSSESIAFAGGETDHLGLTDAGADYTITVDSQTLSSVNVTDVANAETTIQRVDSALTAISDLRSTFGAIQSRFESITANLQTVSENLSASRSRILDADFAAETASLTRSQILQQAGISVLSQANAIPQNVLALLQ